MFNLLVKRVLFPLYLLKNRSQVLDRLAFLEKSQWWSEDRLRAYQYQCLKRILFHAYQTVPFYQRRFAEVGFHPNGFSSLEDMNQLPFTTKEDIQNHLDEMVSCKYSPQMLQEDASGGSTGKPTIFYKDKRSTDTRRAAQIRHDRWSGWDIGKKSIYIWGAQRDIGLYKGFKERLLDEYIYRVKWLDAFDLSDEKIEAFIKIMKTYRPDFILAYANAIYFVAKYLHGKGEKVGPHAGIIASAETLTNEMRDFIQDVFSCKVLNRYGSREMGVIASECQEQKGLHVNSEIVFVETVTFGEIGNSSEVVVTDLHNFGMPLIRYRMGDIAHKLYGRKCPCGRGLPLMGPILGRNTDFIVGKKGKYIHGEYFTHLFYGIRGIKEFHLVQERLDLMTLKLVVEDSFDRTIIEEIRRDIASQLEEETHIDVIFVDRIVKPMSGKYRFTESKVVQWAF